MKIAILGYDVEGRVSYDHFAARGHELEIRDQNPELAVPAGVPSVLGDAYLDGLDQFDLLVRTAGLPPRKILEKNPSMGGKITSHTNEFLKASPTKNIIGVTGTKGKGTTSTLIARILEAAGKTVRLGGNIDLPPLAFLDELTPESWVVLELSSFQLIDLRASPRIAVSLMVVPEHLNWHANMDEYVTAKSQLFIHQKADDTAIYFAENAVSKQIAATSPGRKIPYYAPPGASIENDTISIDERVICRLDELKLLGKHNWQNACAAVTATWQVTQDIDALRSVLTTFAGLEHRLEFVRELRGVAYYNDSFGTTPETAIAAIEAFEQPQVVILGGQPKDVGFEELAKTIKKQEQYVKCALVIGEAQQQIAAALTAAGYAGYVATDAQTMPQIVIQAAELAETAAAEAGETTVVLLSTACASFDMFDNYKQRGELFKQAVRALGSAA
jgi:UDP-N-acetylmuramoylalanine--D-glutamate ligase